MTYKAVNPQFSTFLINTCRSCFAPIKSRPVSDRSMHTKSQLNFFGRWYVGSSSSII